MLVWTSRTYIKDTCGSLDFFSQIKKVVCLNALRLLVLVAEFVWWVASLDTDTLSLNETVVKDCAWLNKKLLPLEGNQQGRFVELNMDGNARGIYVQQMSGTSLADFVRIAQSFKISTANKDKRTLIAEIAAKKTVSSVHFNINSNLISFRL